MNKILTLRNEVVKKLLILALAVTIASIIFKEYSIMKGYLAGLITSLLLFLIRIKQIIKKMANNNFDFVRQSILSFLLRYSVMFIILSLSFIRPDINFYAAFLGILSLQMVIMWNEVIEEKIGFKKG